MEESLQNYCCYSSSAIPFYSHLYIYLKSVELSLFLPFLLLLLLLIYHGYGFLFNHLPVFSHLCNFRLFLSNPTLLQRPLRFHRTGIHPTRPEFTTSRLTGFNAGYFSGGSAILDQNSSSSSYGFSKSLTFRTRSLHSTKIKGVYKIEGRFVLSSDDIFFDGDDSDGRRPSFPRLEGFWSESSGKLCMVGVGSVYSNGGKLRRLSVVRRLSNIKNSNNIADLVTGALESLKSSDDSNYFGPISILFIPEMNYKYSFSSPGCAVGADIPDTPSLGTDSMNSICSLLSSERFELEYPHDYDPSRNCSPFGGNVGYLPQLITLREVHRSEDEDKLQVMLKFQNSSYGYHRTFDPRTTLIGEGSWNGEKTRLCLVACRILTDGERGIVGITGGEEGKFVR